MSYVDGEYVDESWRLGGRSRRVAMLVAAVFAAAALLALAIDLWSETSRDAETLQASTLVTQATATLGLLFLARSRRSISFLVLAVLIAVIAVEEAFHVLNPFAERLSSLARLLAEWSGLRAGPLAAAFIYGFIAALGLGLVLVAYKRSVAAERPVILNIAVLLVVGGIFGGPVGAMSHIGNPRLWVHLEEFGEALVFTGMAGYVAGLVALSLSPMPNEGQPRLRQHR